MLVLSIGVVIAVLVSLMTVLDIRRLRADFADDLKERGLLIAHALNRSLIEDLYVGNEPEVKDAAGLAAGQPEVTYVRILRPDGTVIVDTDRVNPLDQLGEQKMIDALKAHQTVLRRNEDGLQVTSPVRYGDTVLGGVQLGVDGKPLDNQIKSIVLTNSVQGLALLAMGAVLAVFGARYFSQPIVRLATAAQYVTNGEFDRSPFERRSDEIGDLADAFDRMAQVFGDTRRELGDRTLELQDARGRLEDTGLEYQAERDTLERKLGERATELSDAGRRLDIAMSALRRSENKVVYNERLEAEGLMASGITRELNNRLTEILGHSELLLEQLDTFDPRFHATRRISVINEAAQEAANSVKRMTEYYRSGEGD